MINTSDVKLKQLLDKGVNIPSPSTIEIGDEVNINRISAVGVTLHSGTKLFGESTYISHNCVIGKEGPVTIENCWVGPEVQLKGGYFSKSVFLKKASLGYGSHVREGTILEEEASTAHTVGLKQTILFPFVTLGSLINFCDCFMAGGTSRKDHSEVGSSYIHFNYTPNQDKATASLIGDVPRGVMLNNKPIFLGGQGGLVGPCMFNYGTVIAAGTIQRKDELKPERLLFGGAMKAGTIKHTPGNYPNIKRIISHNFTYIANLISLMNWYTHVRSRFISVDFPEELLNGLKLTLDRAIDERIKRLKGLKDKLPDSIRILTDKGGESSPSYGQQHELHSNWNRIQEEFDRLRSPEADLCAAKRGIFLKQLDSFFLHESGKDYITAIKSLDESVTTSGSEWLQEIVDTVYTGLIKMIPTFE